MPLRPPPLLATRTRAGSNPSPAVSPAAKGQRPGAQEVGEAGASAAPAEDGFEPVKSKRRERRLTGSPPPPQPPAQRAKVTPWTDPSLYLQAAAGLPKRFRWTSHNETGHANAHGEDTLKHGLVVVRQDVGARHPTFIDSVNADIYRFDTESGHMAVASAESGVKTCFVPGRSVEAATDHFRRLALTNAVNHTGKPLSALSQEQVERPPAPSGFVSARQALFDAKTRGRTY